MVKNYTTAQLRECRLAYEDVWGVVVANGCPFNEQAPWFKMMERLVDRGMFRPFEGVGGGYYITEAGVNSLFDDVGGEPDAAWLKKQAQGRKLSVDVRRGLK